MDRMRTRVRVAIRISVHHESVMQEEPVGNDQCQGRDGDRRDRQDALPQWPQHEKGKEGHYGIEVTSVQRLDATDLCVALPDAVVVKDRKNRMQMQPVSMSHGRADGLLTPASGFRG